MPTMISSSSYRRRSFFFFKVLLSSWTPLPLLLATIPVVVESSTSSSSAYHYSIMEDDNDSMASGGGSNSPKFHQQQQTQESSHTNNNHIRQRTQKKEKPLEQQQQPRRRRRTSQEDLQEYYDYLEQFNDNTIVGGDDSGAKYPWFVHFASKVCAGTLISSTRVLTSATCLKKTGVPSLVRIGATNSRNGLLMPVRCATIHPDYGSAQTSSIGFEGGGITTTIWADIAILKLASAVDEGIEPVRLPTSTTDPTKIGPQQQPIDVTALGMGYTVDGNSRSLSNKLQELEMESISAGDCQAMYKSVSIIRNGLHLCTLAKKNEGLCTGDSGGPLLDWSSSSSSDGVPTQIGVASFTYGECGTQKVPDIFASVAFYYEWIQSQTVEDYETCDDELETSFSSNSPSHSIEPSGSPSISNRPSYSFSPSQSPSISNHPSQSHTPTILSTLDNVDDDDDSSSSSVLGTAYDIAVGLFNTITDKVDGLVDKKTNALEKKGDWLQTSWSNTKRNWFAALRPGRRNNHNNKD